MIDRYLRTPKDIVLRSIARPVAKLNPTVVTGVALLVGIAAAVSLAFGQYWLGLALWIANRVLDGLDGTIARLTEQQTDLGGYLDILGDMIIYAIIPIALVIAAPSPALYIALIALLASFYINGGSWMLLSSILEKRNQGAKTQKEQTTVTMPTGLIEGGETIAFFCAFIIFPQALFWLFIAMTILVMFSMLQRVLWAVRHID